MDLDDLISVGTIGLIKAVGSFSSEKNVKLATFASRCIENEILMHLRRTVKLKNEVSFDEPLNVDGDGNELVLADVMGTDSDAVYKKIENGVESELLKEALSKLNVRERDYGNALRSERRRRENAERSCRYARHIAVLYLSFRKKDYRKA